MDLRDGGKHEQCSLMMRVMQADYGSEDLMEPNSCIGCGTLGSWKAVSMVMRDA